MPEPPPIRAITFDAAGTLIRVAEPVGETYARIAAEVGATLAPDALDAAFREVFPTMPPMAFPDHGEAALLEAERGWWRELVSRVVRRSGNVPDLEAYFDALFAYYARGAAWRAYPDAPGVLERARRRGLAVAVVSNFDSRLPPILRELGFAPLLDAIVYSTACGAAKPDPGIFRHAASQLDVTPEAVMHVGDNLDADYRGAESAGMIAVHLQRRGRSPTGIAPVVRDLAALEALLDAPR